MIELLSFIPPFTRFPLIECVLSIRVGKGCGVRGRRRGKVRRRREAGGKGRVLRHESQR